MHLWSTSIFFFRQVLRAIKIAYNSTTCHTLMLGSFVRSWQRRLWFVRIFGSKQSAWIAWAEQRLQATWYALRFGIKVRLLRVIFLYPVPLLTRLLIILKIIINILPLIVSILKWWHIWFSFCIEILICQIYFTILTISHIFLILAFKRSHRLEWIDYQGLL